MGTPLRVLIVEDNEDDALLVLRVLQGGGYAPSSLRVDTAQGLAVALETHPWDIVLCDYTLPQYSGADALALVRSRKPDLPVIFVTGTIGEEAAVRLIKAGASDYVLKDRLARLPLAVEQALREAAERRAHEETQRVLHDTAMQLAGVLDAAMDAIFETDAAGTIKLANKAAHRLFGWPPGTLLNQPLSAIIPPERQEQRATGLQRFLETSEGAVIGQTMEVTGLRRDGTRVYCELSASRMPHKNGEQRFVGILRDLTERKKMEAHARRMEYMALLGQLMGGITHEIKNPLFILTGSMQLLNDRLANKEYGEIQGDLDRMDEAAKRMSQTVQRFLSIARPAPPAQEPCAVQAILQQTLDFLRHEFLTNQVSVEANLSPDLPCIESDPRLLQEVFLNLVVNAVQAMREAHGKGKLTVAATLVADAVSTASPRPRVPASDQERHGEGGTRGRGDGANWIEVRIQDDGPGIPPEHRDKLFEPFFTTKPPGMGTGLGLWTVRSNLATVGGTVTLETEVGQGTTFIVRLPVAGAATRGQGDAGMG